MSRTPEGDALALACEKAWRLLDTGDAYGADATNAMGALAKAVDAYLGRVHWTGTRCPICGYNSGHRPFCGLEPIASRNDCPKCGGYGGETDLEKWTGDGIADLIPTKDCPLCKGTGNNLDGSV